MSFIERTSTIRSIRQGEADFTLVDGMVVYPRAMMHILPGCPSQIRDQINFAISEGYLKLVAHVHDNELMWDKLNHD